MQKCVPKIEKNKDAELRINSCKIDKKRDLFESHSF